MKWIEHRLGDVVKLRSGGTPSKAEPRYWDGDIPWLSSKDLTVARIYDAPLRVTEAGAENGTRLMPDNTVMFVVRGMSLAKEFRLSITRRPCTFNQDLKAVECGPTILPNFLYYSLFTQRDRIKGQAGEASHGTKKLESHTVENIKVALPDLDTQQRVIDVASTYDDLIENNGRRIVLLEEAARMLYREWFVHLRFPGHEHVEVIDGLPEGWEALPASTAFEINPSTPRKDDENILYVPMAALSETAMTIDRAPFQLRKKSTNVRFRNGDTLFARITPCLENGKTAYVYFLQDGEVACGSTEFVVLRGRNVSPYFVYLTSRLDPFRQNAIKSMIGSSGRQRVQDNCFDRYRLAVPPKLLASIFDETVKPMFEQIERLDQANQKLARARDLLVPRLMNGEIAV